MNDENLKGALLNSIFEYAVETTKSVSELGIDVIIEEGIIKNIPIVKSIYSLGKSGIALRDKILIKKLLSFITELRDGTLSDENLNEYKENLYSNVEDTQDKIEQTIAIIDSFNSNIKVKIYANFYKALISKDITWYEFDYLSNILNLYFLHDTTQLKISYEKKTLKSQDIVDIISASRLNSIGLIRYFMGMEMVSASNTKESFNGDITVLGGKFYKIGIEPLIVRGEINIIDD